MKKCNSNRHAAMKKAGWKRCDRCGKVFFNNPFKEKITMRKRVFRGWMDKDDPAPRWIGEHFRYLRLRLFKYKGPKEECTGWPPTKVKVTIEEVKK